MPRQPTQGEILAQFNALVPRARELGIRARTRAEWRGGRPAIQAKLDELRASIAQFVTPSIDGVERTFGCEFEFHMPRGMTRDQLSRLLKDAGIDNRVTSWSDKSISSWWKITTDGSLGNYATGTELVSPKLSGARGIELVQKALRVLISARCRVNRECGFHVHVGVKADEAIGYAGERLGFFKNVLHLYRKFEPVIDSILAPSRRGRANRWCGPTHFSDADLDRATTVSDLRNHSFATDKYKKVNFVTYWRQGTVEFRHHQGTINPLTAAKWIGFVLRVVETCSKKSQQEIAEAPANLGTLLSLIEADDNETAFFQARHHHFANGGTD